jgi:hypothetical protein
MAKFKDTLGFMKEDFLALRGIDKFWVVLMSLAGITTATVGFALLSLLPSIIPGTLVGLSAVYYVWSEA